MYRLVVRYLLMVTPPLLGILALLQLGQALAPPAAGPATGSPALAPAAAGSSSGIDLALLLIQLGVILAAARLLGWLFRKFKQPQVLGEMLAGILLGPSLLGRLAPGISAAVFPPAGLGHLNTLSQVGLVVFMFLVGLDLNPEGLKGRTHAAVVTSHVSILAPFFLGTGLAFVLYPRLAPPGAAFSSFALFMGVSMSITAFPVLARILTEHRMVRTSVGAVAITCAAVDDVTSWCILAAVVLISRAGQAAIPFWLTLAGAIGYSALMLFVGRGWLRRFEERYHREHQVSQDLLGLVLLFVLVSACITEVLGIHALFGAFLLGAVMPKDPGFVRALKSKLDDFIVVLLLPLYFAFTGLRTNVGFITGSGEILLYFTLIMVVALLGKFGGAALAARVSGMAWREAGAVGVLMNTRGLVELVVLNIGLDVGVISPPLFTMMVLMALITTLMTTPLLEWIYPVTLRHEEPTSVGQTQTLPARPTVGGE